MVPLHHTGCGMVAFWVRDGRALERGIRASDVVLLDGTAPVPGYPVVCGFCGARIQGMELALVEPTPEEMALASVQLPDLECGQWRAVARELGSN